MASAFGRTGTATISDTERLPWLDLSRDIPLGTRPRKGPAPAARRLIPLALAVAALFVAGVGSISYRLGQDDGAATVAAREPASTTVPLPRSVPPVHAVEDVPVEAPAATLSRTEAPAPRAPVARRPRHRILTFEIPSGNHPYPPEAKSATDPSTPPLLSAAPIIATATVTSAPAPRPRPMARRPGPVAPRGQVLNVGSFKTSASADLAWARMVQRYPYLGSLRRQVTPFYYTRANRTYWRLDLASPSKAHSNRLCGYVRQIGYGCAVA